MRYAAIEIINLTRDFIRYEYSGNYSVSIDRANNPGGVFLYLFQRMFRTEKKVIHALRGINMNINRGTIVGILGPNGSGKSTLLRILAGLLEPSSGEVYIYGKDIRQINVSKYSSYITGLLLGGPWLDPRMTPREVLEIHAKIFDLPRDRIDYALELSGLSEYENVKIYMLSTGLIARIILAQGLLKRAPIYLMDEIFAGISLDERVKLYTYMKNLAHMGDAVILLATNNVWEAQKVCDYVYVLNRGKVIAEGDISSLLSSYKGKLIVEIKIEKNDKKLVDILRYINTSFDFVVKNNVIQIFVKKLDDELIRLMEKLHNKNLLEFVSIRHPNLEDIFLKEVVKNEAR